MTNSARVDAYINKSSDWQPELARLRRILLSTTLHEDFKWGSPCYTSSGKNVVSLVAFKSYFGLWFHQGALLADSNKVLINAQSGKTKALRQWRMTDAGMIDRSGICEYIAEAAANVAAGRAIQPAPGGTVDIPAELHNAMRRHKGTLAAFRNLRAGLQREYCEHVRSAKLAETKKRRIAKILPMILAGAGLSDKYR